MSTSNPVTIRQAVADDAEALAHLHVLVWESRWGTGVGHALLCDALREGSACLWVLHGNERAITFYRGHGFVADGTVRSDEYGTELRMVRSSVAATWSQWP